MDFNSFFQSKKFTKILVAIGALALLLAVFSTGVFVGGRKAAFSYRWGENYHQLFGGPRNGFLQDFKGSDFTGGHGTVGAVIKIESNSLIIKGPDGVEKKVTVDAQTTIRRGADAVKISDIAVDNTVVVIGSPQDDGTIQAKLIRIFDPYGNPMPPPPGVRPFRIPRF